MSHLRNSASSLSVSAIKDPNKTSVKKTVTFLPHIEVCEYISMESQSSSELRALWKWPDENDPEEDTEDLLHELGVTSSFHYQNQCVATLSKCVTQPMSRRRMVWDSIALIILAVEVISFPLGAFEQIEALMSSEPAFIVMDWISACYWLLDMPIQFFAGFNTVDGKIEKRFDRTALRYLKSWFCLDLLIVSLDWASLVGHYNAEFLEALRVGKTVRGIRIVRGVRILRLAKVAPMLQNIADSLYGDLNVLIFKIGSIVGSVVCVNHFIACFWYWLGSFTGEGGLPSWTTDVQASTESAGYQYVASFHWSLSNFATATTRINAVNMWEHFFAIFVLFAGLVSFASSLSAITSAVTDYRALEVDTLQNEKKLRAFFGDRGISPAMSSRIWEFVRSRRRSRPKLTEANVKLLIGLPKILRIELRKDVFLPHLQTHPLFQGLELADPHVISRLCDRGIEFRGAPPMEDVFNRAEKAAHVYYVIGGHLQYYFQRPQARRAISGAIDVNAGEWISEGALWFDNWVHFGWLRAKTQSEFLLVNVEVFQMVALKSPSPYLGSTIYKQAWVKQIKDDVRSQEDGVTRLFKGRPTDLGGDKQLLEHIAHDAFPDLARRYEMRFNPEILKLGSFSSRIFTNSNSS
ncbi:unnamed protein product [Symbiodinium pilosum]|uniref:Ion transport domain-containing protein n=1 Tax=Symbiodinium pilosum TaxID=2952 RepID=A0A812SZN2_SYMPI|nr:unnamed protein product [Symbiodinium pilosum]